MSIRETCYFDPEEQSEPTCPCGYELDLDFTPQGTPWDSPEWGATAFCWNCRFYWGPIEPEAE